MTGTSHQQLVGFIWSVADLLREGQQAQITAAVTDQIDVTTAWAVA